MIEQVTIWKRSHDGKYGVCVLVNIGDNQLGVKDIFRRYKYTFDTIIEAYTRLPHYIEAIVKEIT